MSTSHEVRSACDAVADVWTGVGGPASEPSSLRLEGRNPALPSVFRVTTAATASIAAATLGAAGFLADRNHELVRDVLVDALHAVVAFRSERYVRILDGGLGGLWDPLAGDYRTRDGWIRLHTNYRHHRAAALSVLGAPAERPAIASEVLPIARRSSSRIPLT